MYYNQDYQHYHIPYPQLYFYPTFQIPYPYRQYPEVDDTTFHQSIEKFQKIAKDASVILNKLSNHEFAHQLMVAAQRGNQQEVNRLMNSIGISSPITTKYTPTGLELTIKDNAQGSQCCTLSMYLKWGR